MFIKPIRSNFDHMSWMAFFVPYFLTDFVHWSVAVIFVILKELFDFAFGKGDSKSVYLNAFFDRRGVSWGDLLLGALGILAAMKQGGII